MTRHIIQTDGFMGLFRGLTPTMAREVPGYFFFFGGYEFSRRLATGMDNRDKLGLCAISCLALTPVVVF